MNPQREFARPRSIRLRPTIAGAVLGPITVAGVLLSLMLAGPIALLTSAAVTLLGLATVASWLHVRSLRLRGPRPRQHFVGEAFALEIALRNDSRWLASCGLVACVGEGRTGVRWAGHAPYLPAGATERVSTPHRLRERGPIDELEFSLSSSFPFGLVRCTATFEVCVDFLALPRIGTLEELGRLPSLDTHRQTTDSLRIAGNDELWSVREWREGESLRRAHWKLSAKRSRTIVAQYRAEHEGPLHVVLATEVVDPRLRGRHRSFERAVSLVATAVDHALRERREVRLILLGSTLSPPQVLRGRRGRTTALRALALVEARAGEPVGSLMAEVRAARRAGHAVLGVLASGRRDWRPPAGRASVVLDVDALRVDGVFRRDSQLVEVGA